MTVRSALAPAMSLAVLAADAGAATVDTGGRLALHGSDQGVGALAGLYLGVRALDRLSVGAQLDVSPYFSPTIPKCGGCGPVPQRPQRAGVFAEVSLLPDSKVDPWLRFGCGWSGRNSAGADLEVGAGVDFGGQTAVGPFVMWLLAMGDDPPRRWVSAGVRFHFQL